MCHIAGNLCSILVSGFVCTVISLIKPDNFDWKATREITMIDPEDTGARLSCILMPGTATAFDMTAWTGLYM